MPNYLNISPGLVFWTLVNFTLFALLMAKFAWRPLMTAIRNRENSINEALANAEKANLEAKRLMEEGEKRIASAQMEMANIVREGKQQAEAVVRQALEEAEKVKHSKMEEAHREIEREKEVALQQLRAEVASLVVQATEKVLGQTLDENKHRQLIESSIVQVSNN